MSDQNEKSAFGSNAVDPGLGTDNENNSVDDDREEIEIEPEFRRCTLAEAMGIDPDDEDIDEE